MDSAEQEKITKLFARQFAGLRSADIDPRAEKTAGRALREALDEAVLQMKRSDYDAFKKSAREALGSQNRADFDAYMEAFERGNRSFSLMDARQSFADYVGFLKESGGARKPEIVARKREMEAAFLESARNVIKNMGGDTQLQQALEAEFASLDEETRSGLTDYFVTRLKDLWKNPDFAEQREEAAKQEEAVKQEETEKVMTIEEAAEETRAQDKDKAADEEFSDEKKEELSKTLVRVDKGTVVRINFYLNGHYIDIEGTVAKNNVVYHYLTIGQKKIFYDDIYQIDIVSE